MNSKILLGSTALLGAAIAVGQLTAATDDLRGGTRLDPPAGDRLDQGVFMMNPESTDIYDIAICEISGFSQFNKIGTFPNGTVGLAFGTLGHNPNNGPNSKVLPWFQSPQVHHPVIGMNLYRVNAEGRLEQIGLSWLKHAWLAVNGSACSSCVPSGSGTMLGVGCADPYGSGHNADRFWLGPRWEIDPHQGIWMDGMSFAGSHFALAPGGGGDGGPHGPVDHLLRVRMSDLVTPGATYYFEGFYHLNRKLNDAAWANARETVERNFNNTAHRRATPNHSGNGNFTFGNLGPHVYGPVVMAWGDTHLRAQPESEGTVFIASRVVPVGDQYRYEYAIHNFSLTREVLEFSVPLGIGATATSFGFHAPLDGFWDANNQFVNEAPGYDIAPWTAQADGGLVTFAAMPPEGGIHPNTLRYGTTYTFWFTSNAEPQSGLVSLTPYRPGSLSELTAELQVPSDMGVALPLETVTVNFGTHLSGSLSDLTASDDSKYSVRTQFGFTALEPNISEIHVRATSSTLSPARMDLIIEARSNTPNSKQSVRLLNHGSGLPVLVGEYSMTTVDSTHVIANIANPAAYVRASDGLVEARLRTSVIATFTALGATTEYDLVNIVIQP